MESNKTAIVIGSGVGGLAIAIRLAVKGFEVKVFEKNEVPGGKLSAFELDGFKFDAGPSLFTQPKNIVELFELAQEPIEAYFSFKEIPVSCKYFFDDGKQVNAYSEPNAFYEEMERTLGLPQERTKSYLQNAKGLYENIGSMFLNYSLHKRATWLNKRTIKALRTVKLPYLFSNLSAYNKINLNNEAAEQIFNRFATYNGSNPYSAPAMLSMIPHLELNEGTFYPNGGMISITNALYKLALKKGVQFEFGAAVTSIIQADGKVQGIVVNDQNIFADTVVSNVDVHFTYETLLRQERRAAKILKQERSSSALVFYWGINRSVSELGLHNILFSNEYKNEFEAIFSKGQIIEDPTIYINITSKEDVGQAPNGMENWFVMINAPANKGQDWDVIATKIRALVIEKINKVLQQAGIEIDLEESIVIEKILTPALIEENTGSYMGSLYGSSSNSKTAAFMRHPNFSRKINGLYFCGGSVHPGGGIPLCLKSAQIITEQLIK